MNVNKGEGRFRYVRLLTVCLFVCLYIRWDRMLVVLLFIIVIVVVVFVVVIIIIMRMGIFFLIYVAMHCFFLCKLLD